LGLVTAAPASLAHLVERVWDWETAPQPFRLERVLPSAGAGLILNLFEDETRVYDECRRPQRLAAVTLDGPRTTSVIIDSVEQTAVMGVVFRPGGAARMFRERMDRLHDRSVDLDALLGAEVERLRSRLLEAPGARARLELLCDWLARRAPAAERADPLEHALARLRAVPSVDGLSAVARELGVSPRRLTTQFRERVGLSPKRYLRLQRFRRLVADAAQAPRIDWVALAADGGYCDQAHMTHEFRRFCGVTPGAWMRRGGIWPDHVPLD